MKKIIALFLALISSLTLVACGDKTKPTDDKPSNGGVQVNPNATVIKYCTWSFGTEEENNMTRRLVAEFNKTHSDIQIEIVVPDGDYDTFLTTMASGRNLPDVFMVNSVPTAVINYLAGDITDVATADPEWATIDAALRESITYNNRIFGIPCGQYYMGFFANYTLIDNYLPAGSQDANIAFAPGNFTTEQFISTVKNVKRIDVEDGTGVIGINATGDMINWLPSTLDETGKTGHFVWNAETKSFGYTSQIMYDALTMINELGDRKAKYTFEAVMAEDTDNKIFGTGDSNAAFINGQLGFIQSGTWATYENSDVLDYHFVAYPDSTVVSASDYMCISRSTKNKAAAYEVAKYLSFGVEGTNARFSIIDANPKAGLSVQGLPVVNNEEIADKWFEYVTLDGAQEVYEGVVAGEIKLLVEGNKSIPGFQDARFLGSTGLSYEDVRGGAVLNMSDFIWDVCGGQISVSQYQSDFTSELAGKMNKYVSDAYAKIEEVVNK